MAGEGPRAGRLCVKNFRAIGEACIGLKPVTLLVGPPVGKTTLLEALALIGYGVKYVYEVGREYSEPQRVGALGRFLRIGGCGAAGPAAEAWLEAGGRRVGVSASCRDGDGLVIEYIEDGEGGPRVRATIVTRLDEAGEAKSRRLASPSGRGYLAPRLYSYDLLAYDNVAQGRTGASEPRSYLAEDASNLGTLLASMPWLLDEINRVAAELAGAELRVLLDRRVSVFAGYVEVGPGEAATTVLRLAYYYSAVRALGPQDAIPIVGLDDPEAHMSIGAVEELADAITNASERAIFLVATHSPVLVSRLAGALGEERLGVVYLTQHREPGGGMARTEPVEVPASKVADIGAAMRLLRGGPGELKAL